MMVGKSDAEEIDEIFNSYKQLHKSYNSSGSKVYEAFVAIGAELAKDGALSRMHKELIALGIASVLNSKPCIVWHMNGAFKSGASEEQIVEAIEVAIEMGGGPVVGRSSFSFKVLEHLKGRCD